MARERLDKALFRVARETDVDELRLRRWVSFLALCGVLQRAIDEGVISDYHLKGGAALELRFAHRARTTKDMDVGLPGNSRRDRFAALERAAALGFDEFTFRVKVPRDLEHVDTVRVDAAITYRGHGFQTIQIDLGPADEPTVDLVAPTIRGVAELGIPVTSPVRCITLDIQVAQKLHACTNPRVLEGENRARDILDAVFLDMLGQLDPKAVQSACIRVFDQRAEHAWPPSVNVPPAAGIVSVRATLTENLDGKLVSVRSEDREITARHQSSGVRT